MRIEYSYLKKFLVSNESQNKLSAIFTDLGFECEVDGNCIDFDLTPNRGDAFSLKGWQEIIGHSKIKISIKNLFLQKIILLSRET